MPFYYAVKKGHVPGVYNDWASCAQQVKGFPNARYKKFASETEAIGFVWDVTAEVESHKSNADGEPSSSTSNTKSEAQSNSSYVNSWVKQQQHLKAASSSFCSSSSQRQNASTAANLDVSAATEAVDMLRATARTLQSSAEQLMKGVGALSSQIDELAASLHSGGSTGGGVRDNLKRLYSDYTPLGKSGGTHDSTSATNAAKKSKKAKLESSASTDCGFTGAPFPEDAGEIVYTDGSSFGNGKATARAGIGIYWGPDNPHNTSERLTGRQTNNRAEIHAAEVAILQAKDRGIENLILHTDSQFLINGITGWIKKWKKNGWKLASGGDVINREDFEKLDKAIAGINVKWMHVRGHQGIEGNEAADGLANDGARKPLD